MVLEYVSVPLFSQIGITIFQCSQLSHQANTTKIHLISFISIQKWWFSLQNLWECLILHS